MGVVLGGMRLALGRPAVLTGPRLPQTYTDTHARTLVLDPLSSVRPLLDRFESCLLLRDLRAQGSNPAPLRVT